MITKEKEIGNHVAYRCAECKEILVMSKEDGKPKECGYCKKGFVKNPDCEIHPGVQKYAYTDAINPNSDIKLGCEACDIEKHLELTDLRMSEAIDKDNNYRVDALKKRIDGLKQKKVDVLEVARLRLVK